MSIARAGSKNEALRLLAAREVLALELDYETGWQDAVELGRLGEKRGIRVQYRGQESIAVRSHEALVEGLAKAKTTFRQRNLYCLFDLGAIPDQELHELEARASRLGDYILAGHLLREVDAFWQ
ncbi:PHA-granule associated protein 4 [Cupriavidus gilardii]|uniref:PHA-granule associated protein 4 n=1 Tax=Cupriavidus gilardii TaxID=82541 RepID=UPI001571967D|nr:PHA-granule associated protein 4 [Cupriavidus gilardii]MCG5261248.1 PHA-granule associated protein 4 [Cupriavidus gilardii]MDF9428519.1 PHA-granule associated protein 4 [Cupriavidus gilardii]NSX03959.1 PHA-granule associated protein 4 [Cupriavidus gilardii]